MKKMTNQNSGFSVIEMMVAVAITVIGGLTGSVVILETTKQQAQIKAQNESYSYGKVISNVLTNPQLNNNCASALTINNGYPISFSQLEGAEGLPARIQVPGAGPIAAGSKIPGTNIVVQKLNFLKGVRLATDTISGRVIYDTQLVATVQENPQRPSRVIVLGHKNLVFTPDSSGTGGAFSGCNIPTTNVQVNESTCAALNKVFRDGECVNSLANPAPGEPGGCNNNQILLGIGVSENGIQKNCMTLTPTCSGSTFIQSVDMSGGATCYDPVTSAITTASSGGSGS